MSANAEALLDAVRRKPGVMVKITSFAKSREGLAAHLDYIARNGQNEVFDPTSEGFGVVSRNPRKFRHSNFNLQAS